MEELSVSVFNFKYWQLSFLEANKNWSESLFTCNQDNIKIANFVR